MAKKPLTEAQKKARAAKAAATRAANQKKALKDLGLERPKAKKRRTRKMTPEQKKAAGERLAKARAAKAAASGAPKYASYDASIRDLPEDDMFSIKSVTEILKYQKEILKSMRGYKDSKDAKERAQHTHCQVYIENLNNYLRTGVWQSMFYGKDGNIPVKYICRSMSYTKDGTPKRTVGTWYPDIASVWTEDMSDE